MQYKNENNRMTSSSTFCLGVNDVNGMPCRNRVSSSRAFQYCHLHHSQILNKHPPRPSQSTEQRLSEREVDEVLSPWVSDLSATLRIPGAFPLPDDEIRPDTSSSIAAPPPVPPKDKSIAALQLSANDVSVPLPKANPDSELDLAPSIPKTIPLRVVRAPSSPITEKTLPPLRESFNTKRLSSSQASDRSGGSFNFKKLLKSLPCFSTPETDEFPPNRRRSISPASVMLSTHEVSPVPNEKILKENVVTRNTAKALPMSKSTQQLLMEQKIKRDRIEIERLLSTDNLGLHKDSHIPADVPVRSSPDLTIPALPTPSTSDVHARAHERILQPTVALNHQMMTKSQADYFLKKYTDAREYPENSLKTMTRLRETVSNIVQDALLKRLPIADIDTTEYIYVFRHNRDYHNTPTIALKIGRSKDVEARLKQWFDLCRYPIDRLEQFETRYAVLLERMMHLEFQEDRVPKQCRCGRVHREWFEIRREGAKGRIRRTSFCLITISWRY